MGPTHRPLFGTHVSVAGGVALAVARARALSCESVQIFTRNPNRWQSPPLEPAQVRAFVEGAASAALSPVFSHASYLINLASPTLPLLAQSVEALIDELRRAESLGLAGVVLHPGARSGQQSEAAALRAVAAAARVAVERSRTSTVRLLIEHTAGQGRCLGHRFEHLAEILAHADLPPARLGVCLDTCHLLAAGYDIATADGYARTLKQFETTVGLHRLHAVHANDSKRPCGSRVDRHEHIGRGHVGLDGFARLVNDRRLSGLPFLLETEKRPLARPTNTDPDPLDAENLATLRGLVRSREGRSRTGSRIART